MTEKTYTQLSRLAIAKLTSTPTPGVLWRVQRHMTPAQAFNAQRLVNKLRPTR